MIHHHFLYMHVFFFVKGQILLRSSVLVFFLLHIGSKYSLDLVNGNRTHFEHSRCISSHSEGYTSVLVGTTSAGMLYKIHGHALYTWSAVSLCLALVTFKIGFSILSPLATAPTTAPLANKVTFDPEGSFGRVLSVSRLWDFIGKRIVSALPMSQVSHLDNP